MLYGFLLIIHLIVSILLVVTILMQSSKGGGLAGLGGGLGGPGGGSMLGGRQAATLLHKVTVTLALVFGINALILGGLSRTSSAPHSATLESLSEEQGGGQADPLEFLGDSAIEPTEGQVQQARDNMPTPAEEGSGDAEAAGGGDGSSEE